MHVSLVGNQRNMTLAVFILETHNPSRRIMHRSCYPSSASKDGTNCIRRIIRLGGTWANIFSASVKFIYFGIKTGTRRIMRLDELSSLLSLRRRIKLKWILRPDALCLAKFVPDELCVSNIKTAIYTEQSSRLLNN